MRVQHGREYLEKLIGQTFAQVLERDTVGPDDDFFLLGGHSLLVVRLVRSLQAEGVEIKYEFVFDGRSIRGIANKLLQAPD
ncbi:phosphopantetheine-binding protein [Nonomuraea sp. NPDC004354]